MHRNHDGRGRRRLLLITGLTLAAACDNGGEPDDIMTTNPPEPAWDLPIGCIEATPEQVDFGVVSLADGDDSTQVAQVTFVNRCEGELELLHHSLPGGTGAEGPWTLGDTTHAFLGMNESGTFKVTFAPTEVGVFESQATGYGNVEGDIAFEVPLRAEVVDGE